MSADLPLVIQFDDYCRKFNFVLQNDCTQEFLTFARYQEQCRLKWRDSVMECKRLKLELDDSVSKISQFEKKLTKARFIVDSERKRADKAEAERNELIGQVQQIEDILSCVGRAGNQLANETKEKLDRFLNTTQAKIRASSDMMGQRLQTIDEINSTARMRQSSSPSVPSSSRSDLTGSLLSDVSYTRSEDNLDLDLSRSNRSFFRPPRSLSPNHEDVSTIKKRRSSRKRKSTGNTLKVADSEKVISTTTFTFPAGTPVATSSTLETIPTKQPMTFQPSAPPKTSSDTDSEVSEMLRRGAPQSSPTPTVLGKLFTRQHCFRSKTCLRPTDDCCFCLKKLNFGKSVFSCSGCRAMTHAECKDKVPLPCIPTVETPRRTAATTIADYCGRSQPMIPPLVVHCVMEVETRGLTEVGIYRVPGSERDVRSLKERFLRGKGVCSLASYDINVVCGTVKDFLRGLSEPLVTFALRSEFMRAAEQAVYTDPMVIFSPIIAQLPQANRDTLAFIMQHLQKVALSADCKMSKSNLAKVFGPTLVGYGNSEQPRGDMYVETEKVVQVVQCLLDLPDDYWLKFVNDDNNENLIPVTPIGSLGFRKRTRAKNIKLYTPPLK